MKHKSSAYAKALVQVLDMKGDAEKIAQEFLLLVRKNGDTKRIKEILLLTEGMLLKKTGKKKVTIETARKINIDALKTAFTKEGDVVEEKVNPALVAGVKVIVNGETQLDISLKSKLEKIFH